MRIFPGYLSKRPCRWARCLASSSEESTRRHIFFQPLLFEGGFLFIFIIRVRSSASIACDPFDFTQVSSANVCVPFFFHRCACLAGLVPPLVKSFPFFCQLWVKFGPFLTRQSLISVFLSSQTSVSFIVLSSSLQKFITSKKKIFPLLGLPVISLVSIPLLS